MPCNSECYERNEHCGEIKVKGNAELCLEGKIKDRLRGEERSEQRLVLK